MDWPRGILLGIAMLGTATAGARERWIYVPANFQVDAEADRVAGLVRRAADAGYTHALVTDSKFSRLATVTENYRPNVERVKEVARAAGIELVPAVCPVGYSNDLLFHNPNLAEGLPVREARFVLKDGVAIPEADPPVALPPCGRREGWDFVDANLVPGSEGFRSTDTGENARMHKRVQVAPFRQYRLSVEIRARDLAGGRPEIKAIGEDGRSLQWTNLRVEADGGWHRHDVTFNSLGNAAVGIYFGVWGGHRGTVEWRRTSVGECGAVNLLRRPGAPVVVRAGDGRLLEEGRDFERWADPETGTRPWAGEYTAWHEPPALRTKGIPDGEVLRVSYFHAHVIYDGQVCGCVHEPDFRALLESETGRIADMWGSRTHLMSHDEWRLMGWDASCIGSGMSPAETAADNVAFCTSVLRRKVPDGRILVWSDMFDPHHNAVDDYYLVNGTLDGSWKGLDPGVEVMNWNFGRCAESLRFFAGRGHAQVIAGFYDEPPGRVREWLASAADVPLVKGFMYTTWRGDYSKLEDVAGILDEAGW